MFLLASLSVKIRSSLSSKFWLNLLPQP